MSRRTSRDEGGQYVAVQLGATTIPPVAAVDVRKAAGACLDYGQRNGLSMDEIIDLLHMLRINGHTMEHGLHPHQVVADGAA